MKASQLTLGLLPFGAVYLVDRDLTLAEKRRDMQNIKALHFTTVVLWPAVSRWDGDPPGQTAFQSIDDVLDICQEIGLRVILELQGQNTSNQEAPELFGLTENKTDLNNPEYRALTERYLREVAHHYKGHPALIAYDIYNEVGFHGKDPWTIEAFVEFLKLRYANDIQALNRAWGTYFAAFEAITRMTPTFNAQYDLWYSVVPQLDWLRFRPYNWAKRLDEWTQIIREIDPHIAIMADVLGNDTMHNRSGDYYGATDWRIAEHVEALGLSCWANMLGENWMVQDAFRWPQFWRAALSAGRNKQVIISEMMTPNRTMFPVERSSMTDQIRLWSYQAIFNGLKGLIYWQYRPFRKGIQVAGRGLCDFSGKPNEHAAQAAEVASFVERYADALAGAYPDHSGCAILHDHNAQDIYSTMHNGDFYTDAHGGMFWGLWHYGISAAYVIPDDLPNGVPSWVKVLVVPCNVSISQVTATALIEFIKGGGILLTESRFGLIDSDGTLWSEVPGGQLAQVSGFHEASTTCLFNDAVDFDGSTLKLIDDYYQYLALGSQIDIILKTNGGEPALIVSHIGTGQHIHVPFIISHKINQQAPGALTVFRAVVDRIRPMLRPQVPIIDKTAHVDVSTLLDEQDRPWLIGITNYEQTATMVRLQWPTLPLHIEGSAAVTAQVENEQLLITIPARQAAALFLINDQAFYERSGIDAA